MPLQYYRASVMIKTGFDVWEYEVIMKFLALLRHKQHVC